MKQFWYLEMSQWCMPYLCRHSLYMLHIVNFTSKYPIPQLTPSRPWGFIVEQVGMLCSTRCPIYSPTKFTSISDRLFFVNCSVTRSGHTHTHTRAERTSRNTLAHMVMSNDSLRRRKTIGNNLHSCRPSACCAREAAATDQTDDALKVLQLPVVKRVTMSREK